jgi:hypothetical protein
MAAALHTTQHADDQRARQHIQRVMAMAIVVRPPRYHTGRLGAGYAGVVIGKHSCACATVWEYDNTVFMNKFYFLSISSLLPPPLNEYRNRF